MQSRIPPQSLPANGADRQPALLSAEWPSLFSGLTPELTTPVAALVGITQRLTADLETLERHQVRQAVSTLHSGVLALSGLVDSVLTATRIQTGHFQFRAEALNLLDVVLAVLPTAEVLLGHKAQRLQLRSQRGLPPVAADGQQLGHALTVLLTQASAVTAHGEPIAVLLAQRGAAVRVTVADRGPRLVDRSGAFRFQEPHCPDAAAPVGPGGAGLALTVVATIIAAHGGEMGAANRRGGGACCWFELPGHDEGWSGAGASDSTGVGTTGRATRRSTRAD